MAASQSTSPLAIAGDQQQNGLSAQREQISKSTWLPFPGTNCHKLSKTWSRCVRNSTFSTYGSTLSASSKMTRSTGTPKHARWEACTKTLTSPSPPPRLTTLVPACSRCASRFEWPPFHTRVETASQVKCMPISAQSLKRRSRRLRWIRELGPSRSIFYPGELCTSRSMGQYGPATGKQHTRKRLFPDI